MEDKNATKPAKQAKMLLAKFQNHVQLCEQKEEDGSDFFFVRVLIGKNYFFIGFDELRDAMEQFGQIVDLKRGKKKYDGKTT